VTPVECAAVHSGRIVQFTSSSTDCPAAAELYVSDSGGFWCIDTDL
jgi:hypothetical protein